MSIIGPQEPQTAPERTILAKIFLSSEEARLRAGWRIAAHSIAYNILLICIGLPITLLIMFAGMDYQSLWLSQALNIVALTVTIFLARRFLDRRSITSLGLKLDGWMVADLLMGIFITFVMMGLIYFIMSAAGWLTFEGFAWEIDSPGVVWGGALTFFVTFILVGWNEELLFRGYRLQNISAGLNPIWAVLISSAWFGAAHLLNPNANFISTLGIFLAGLFLAYPYLRTRQLWLSIGLHIGWNFFEGVVFGFPVSGLEIYPLTRIQIHGPELWTGGAFGPEAGFVLLPALLIGAALIYVYTRARKAEFD